MPIDEDRMKMARAAARALGIWFAFYVLLMHCFVIWKWQTPEDPTLVPQETKTTVNDDEEVKSLDGVIAQLQQAIAAQTKNNIDDAKLNALASDLKVQEMKLKDLTIATDPSERTTTKEPLRLKQLLSVPELGELRSAGAVDKTFKLAVQELNTYIAQKKWTELAEFFQTFDFPDYTGESATLEYCRASGGLSPQQLLDAQVRIDQAFSVQLAKHGLPLSFSESVESLQETLKEVSANLTASTQERPKPVGCLASTDQVMPWVEAGIDAVSRKQDVRQALLTVLQKDGIDTSKIILDADLQEEQEEVSVPLPDKVNLRQLLDTPSLRDGANVVDQFLYLISGYVDALDQALDKYVYANVDDDDDEGAVGRAAASALMGATGRMSIPVPPILQESKAGALR